MSVLLSLEYFTHWLANGERGISSEAIVSQLTGQQVGRRWSGSDHPHDPGDFRRCELLLRNYPLARLTFVAEMPKRSEVWTRLVEHWDELVALIETECPDAFNGRRSHGSAPKAYQLMKELRTVSQ